MRLFERFEFAVWFILLGWWIANAWRMIFYSRSWVKGRFAHAISQYWNIPEPH